MECKKEAGKTNSKEGRKEGTRIWLLAIKSSSVMQMSRGEAGREGGIDSRRERWRDGEGFMVGREGGVEIKEGRMRREMLTGIYMKKPKLYGI